jgi:hypothetical protein
VTSGEPQAAGADEILNAKTVHMQMLAVEGERLEA